MKHFWSYYEKASRQTQEAPPLTMPVIDETRYTLELKAFRKEILDFVEDLKKKVSTIEEKLSKGK
jgi:hypothetical protein